MEKRIAVMVLVLTLCVGSGMLHAQVTHVEKPVSAEIQQPQIAYAYKYQYAVKFICGKCKGDILSPGKYLTAINVHNPNTREARFMKTFSVALPGQKQGPVSEPVKCSLKPNHSFEIDCPDISRHAPSRSEFKKGFVVIDSIFPLDVVAVYTAGGVREEVKTMHTERVPPRKILIPADTPLCPDLIVEKIEKPQWDGDNNRSIINAVIKNIGNATASQTIARVIDPSTLQSTGAPYNAIANTPDLAPGASVVVTFYLPYWVYNPDAELEVTADYKGMLQECDEGNNTMTFADQG